MMHAANHGRSRALATKSLLLGIAILAGSASLVGSAHATAIYSSAARSTFTLDPVGPVSTITDHAPFTGTSGTGLASIDTFAASGSGTPSDPGVYPVTVDSKVSGSAVAPPDSSSSAEAKRGHVFVVPRVSSTGPLPTVTMRFAFEIAWETHLAIDLPGSEFARGGAFFAISGFEDGIDSIVLDTGMPGAVVTLPSGEHAWQYSPMYDTAGGSPVDEVHSTTVTGFITVLAGMVGEFSVITDTAGFAGARVVPEPATSLLLALPLVWFIWTARRRRVAGKLT